MSTNLSALDYVILFVMLNLMFLLFTGSSAYAMLKRRDRARFARLERKLDAILKHLGIDAHQFETLSEEVKKLADEGKKIPAIKLHREQTGLGLRDAKEDVEAYLEQATKPA